MDEKRRHKFEPSTNAMIAGIHSDSWVDDLDLLSSMPNSELQEKVNKDISYSDLYRKCDEAKLIDNSIKLYNDLVKIEDEETKTKQYLETELESCKNELEKYRKADIKSKARIEKLTTENVCLKKSISSAYRTFSSEIQYKNKLLADINIENDRLQLHLKAGETLKSEKCLNCEDNSKKENNTSKRKQFESPEQPSNKRECKSDESKTGEIDLLSEKDKRNFEKGLDLEITRNSHSSDLRNNKQIPKEVKDDKETQTSNDCVFCQSYLNSKTFRENNDMFFNLLPDSLKISFSDYERRQVIALNRLKEKFVDEYFNSIDNVPSPSSESSSKREDVPTEEYISGKSSENKSTSSASGSVNSKRTELVRKYSKDELDKRKAKNDFKQKYDTKVRKNYHNSRQRQKDLICLFRYRNEKIPFEEKKKFGLHKKDQKLIPEKLL